MPTTEEVFVHNAHARGYKVIKGGWPDYLLVAPDGSVEFVELKHEDEPLRGTQPDILNALASIECKVWISIEGSFENRSDPFDWPIAKAGRPTGRMSKKEISHGTAAQYRWKLRNAQAENEEEQNPERKEKLMLEIIRYKRLLERPEEETEQEARDRVHWDPVRVNARREKHLHRPYPDLEPSNPGRSMSEFALEQLQAIAEEERKRKEAKEKWEREHPE